MGRLVTNYMARVCADYQVIVRRERMVFDTPTANRPTSAFPCNYYCWKINLPQNMMFLEDAVDFARNPASLLTPTEDQQWVEWYFDERSGEYRPVNDQSPQDVETVQVPNVTLMTNVEEEVSNDDACCVCHENMDASVVMDALCPIDQRHKICNTCLPNLRGRGFKCPLCRANLKCPLCNQFFQGEDVQLNDQQMYAHTTCLNARSPGVNKLTLFKRKVREVVPHRMPHYRDLGVNLNDAYLKLWKFAKDTNLISNPPSLQQIEELHVNGLLVAYATSDREDIDEDLKNAIQH